MCFERNKKPQIQSPQKHRKESGHPAANHGSQPTYRQGGFFSTFPFFFSPVTLLFFYFFLFLFLVLRGTWLSFVRARGERLIEKYSNASQLSPRLARPSPSFAAPTGYLLSI